MEFDPSKGLGSFILYCEPNELHYTNFLSVDLAAKAVLDLIVT
jgi:hypothetical protein